MNVLLIALLAVATSSTGAEDDFAYANGFNN